MTNNMFVYEYHSGQKVERLIVDCGIGFPEVEMYGVDLLVPDITYLKDKQDSLVGMILTHGHDDHIAALPYILPQLKKQIPIYASELTAGFAESDLQEFNIKQKVKVFPNESLRLGSFTIEPIRITHSVPDSRHLAIQTPEGTIYHGSDFKFDWTPIDGKRSDVQKMAYFGHKKVLMALVDCLRVENEGYSLSETKVGENLSREIRDVKGKVIVTMMSSNIHRIQQAIDAAVEHNRNIVFIGQSVEDNIQVSQELGFIRLPKSKVVHKRRLNKYADHELCLIVAGSQGQLDSSLNRIARGEHKLVTLRPSDHVIFSADPIPGNEQSVYDLIDKIAETGATVSYREIQDVMHVSGHASAEEMRLLLSLTSPKFIIPIGGTYRHMNQFKVLATNMGWKEQDIILPKDGDIIAFDKDKVWIDNKIKLKTVMVDGLGVGDVGPLVLSDRKKMAKSGMVIVAVPIDKKENQIISEPEVITRGFVFVRGSQQLIKDLTNFAAKILPKGMIIRNWQEDREELEQRMTDYIYTATQREPLILGVLVKS